MFYPAAHPVIIYQATQLPQGRPQIIKSSLDIITSDKLTGIATLYLPPVEIHKVDAAMCERLGLFPKSNKQADLDDVGSLHPSACAL